MMSEIIFVPEENDSLGLQSKIPYIGVKLTPSEMKIIGDKTPQIYMTLDTVMFKIRRGKEREDTGECMLYILFK